MHAYINTHVHVDLQRLLNDKFINLCAHTVTEKKSEFMKFY